MHRLKITVGNKYFEMGEVISCVKLDDIGRKQVDYKYVDSEEENPVFFYFEVEFATDKKILAVAGNVELMSVPIQEEKLQEWIR